MTKTTVVSPSAAPAPLQIADKSELVKAFNAQAEAIKSINAGMTMTLTAGSAYSGVIKQYHEVSGFILAQRPSDIRVIGQLPVVGTNIFDMVSDGKTFEISIPSQSKFLTGPANLERPSSKPIENLRPQHLLDAIFWRPIGARDPVLIEEAMDGLRHFYVLTVVRRAVDSGAGSAAAGTADWEIERKIWFDRADLQVSRLTTYDPGGKIASDIRYNSWNVVTSPKYPAEMLLARPGNDYELKIEITKATFNEEVAADRFVLAQPPGVQVVHVGDETQAQGDGNARKATETPQ